MYQAQLQRSRVQEGEHAATTDNLVNRDTDAAATLLSKLLPPIKNLSWLIGGMALGAMTVIVAWWAVFFFMEDGTGRSYITGSLPSLPSLGSQFIGLPSQSSPTKEIREDIDSLTEQVQTLNASVADLKVKLLDIHTVADAIAILSNEFAQNSFQRQGKTSDAASMLGALSPPAAGTVDAANLEPNDIDRSDTATSSSLSASIENTSTATERQAQEGGGDGGGWIIVLASTANKEDAERYVDKTRSRGVDAGIYQATVRERNYWRVYVPGFAKVTEAKTQADLLEEKLGLKDVWVTKR